MTLVRKICYQVIESTFEDWIVYLINRVLALVEMEFSMLRLTQILIDLKNQLVEEAVCIETIEE